MYNGLHDRVQVELDYSTRLPEKLLVKILGLNFFVKLEYEDLPAFCVSCELIGHELQAYKKNKQVMQLEIDGGDGRVRSKNNWRPQTGNYRRETITLGAVVNSAQDIIAQERL